MRFAAWHLRDVSWNSLLTCRETRADFSFEVFYDRLNERGFVIYPGKVTDADCFRIGNIGRLFPEDMTRLLAATREVLEEMNVALPAGAGDTPGP